MADRAKRRVLITGAGGRIGGHLATALQDRYSLRLQYNKTMPDTPPVEDWVQADIADYDQIAPAMEGIDAVIHMAGEPSPYASWDEVNSANIVGTRNVYEAARVAGVRKVVLASTNHVMGFYDRDGEWPIYVSQPVRPDSLYGVSKAFGEILGRYYADQHGLAVICLRIGWFLDEPHDRLFAVELAQPAGLHPDLLAGGRDGERLRNLLRHLGQLRPPLGSDPHDGRVGVSAGR